MLFGTLLISSSSSSYPSSLILGPSVEGWGWGGHLGRREKLFQKCPVTPAEEGALFSLSDDAGGAAFLLPVTYNLLCCSERLPYISPCEVKVRWSSAVTVLNDI